MSVELLEQKLNEHIRQYEAYIHSQEQYHRQEEIERKKNITLLNEIRDNSLEAKIYSKSASEESKQTNGKLAQALKDIAKNEKDIALNRNDIDQIIKGKDGWANSWRGLLFAVIVALTTPIVTVLISAAVQKSVVDQQQEQIDALTKQIQNLETIENY